MDLSGILVFLAAAFAYALLPARWRGWIMLVGGGAAVYLLQPRLNIRFADFILPTVSIVLVIAAWLWTRAPDQRPTREDGIAAALLIVAVLLLAINRYLPEAYRITPSRPPDTLQLIAGLALAGAFFSLLWIALSGGKLPLSPLAWERGLGGEGSRLRRTLNVFILLLVVLFIALKAEPIARSISAAWRTSIGQDATIASAIDLNWLGFSYLAFRLIHTLFDRRSGVLPALTLREYVSYALFPPALVAGPIDRAERFVKDFRALPQMRRWDADRFARGGSRVAMGIFKKFVIADTLALGLSLNALNAEQAVGAGGLWLLLYGYALRLFFDFSGYSDIAIGIGILFGIRLPENFDRPYLKTSITTFWQSWHKTLSDWARFYIFSPLSRSLLKRKHKPSSTVIVGIAQTATMVTIGLWHGITVNFLIWGLWQAAGLYVHKLWSDRTRMWYRDLPDKPGQKRLWTVFTWFITFHYVVVGWVWFALPEFQQSASALTRLFGIGW